MICYFMTWITRKTPTCMDIYATLEPILDFFRSLHLPDPVIRWGHPLMMGSVVIVMGSAVGLTGWRGRELVGQEAGQMSLMSHRNIAPWMAVFITLGYTGGILSLAMQGKPMFTSPHFWLGSSLLGLLALSAGVSLTGFAGNQQRLRTLHAYLGGIILSLLFAHAMLGLKLGLSL
jgi:hypothetical protein